MTDVEYTEKAIDHLQDLDSQIADGVMNKVDETTDWTEHCLEPLSGYPYYKLRAGDCRAIISGTAVPTTSASRLSVTVEISRPPSAAVNPSRSADGIPP